MFSELSFYPAFLTALDLRDLLYTMPVNVAQNLCFGENTLGNAVAEQKVKDLSGIVN